MRRLPVYLVLDTSESMVGEAIAEVNKGLTALSSYLRSDPHALETAYISVISFDSAARTLVPLTEVALFKPPHLVLGAGTCLGAALDLLQTRLRDEIQARTEDRKGDYMPIVYIITDGAATDSWREQAKALRKRLESRRALVVAIACGPDASVENLREITPEVLMAADSDADSLRAIFQWLSMSISTSSLAVERTADILDFSKLPDVLKKSSGNENRTANDPQVFLHARCALNRGFYIMRYKKHEDPGAVGNSGAPIYLGHASYPLSEFYFDRSERARELKITADQLYNAPHCPYCEANAWALCGCGGIHCFTPSSHGGPVSMRCPWCENEGYYELGSDFSVGRSAG